METSDVAANGASAILETLRRWGIDRLFICPGSTEVALLDASFGYPDVELVLATHESVAVAMADGYARATDRPSVAYLHTNVGLTNGLSHLHCAQVASSPLVVLTGLKSTAIQNGRAFTSNPQVRDLARPFCKWDWQTLRPEAVAEDVDRALRLARSAPAGPTFLGLPQDLIEARVPVPLLPPPDGVSRGSAGRSRPSSADVGEAVAALRGARQPLVVAGAEVATDEALEPLLRLVERLDAPVVTEDRRNLRGSAVPTAHPHYAGMLDRDGGLLRSSDVVVLAGVRAFTEFEPSTRPPLSAGRRVVHLHPSREEVVRVSPVDVALIADSGLALEDLLADLPVTDPTLAAERRRHLDAAVAAHRRERERLRAVGDEDADLLVASTMSVLTDLLPHEAVVVADAVTSEPALISRLRSHGPGALYASGGGGSLGWGMGASLGVAFADPERRIVSVIGDGVFQFGLPALWTAARHGLDVTTVVVNNRSYAAVKSALYRHGGEAARRDEFPTTDITGPDIAAVARGFGLAAWSASTPGSLRRALTEALRTPGPNLVEALTDPADLGPIRPVHVRS